MKLKLEKRYLSISNLPDIHLPDFTIITGINGAGKSHFLNGIKNKHISIEGIDNKNISIFTFANFSFALNGTLSSGNLHEEYKYIIQAFQQKKASLQKLASEFPLYKDIKDFCVQNQKNITDLNRSDFSDELTFDLYVKYISGYKTQVNSFTVNVNPQQQYGSTRDFGLTLLDLAESLPYSIHELNDIKFKQMFTPYKISKALLPENLERMFFDYYSKYQLNKYHKFLVEDDPNNAQHYSYFSDAEFENVYGSKPWEIINSFLNELNLGYKLNTPEGLTEYSSFDLKILPLNEELEENSIIQLSSGEKILVGLVGLLYKMKLESVFPDVILFDEVDASLHPSMIQVFLDVLNKTILSSGTKIILVTHSPTMVALAPEESIHIMQKNANPRIYKSSKEEALKVLTEGFASLTYLESQNSISYSLSKNSIVPVLFTEGITDKIILEQAWAKLYNEQKMPFIIQDCFDAAFLKNMMMRGDEGDGVIVKYPKPFFALFDFDKEGFQAWSDLSKRKFNISINNNPNLCLISKHHTHDAYCLLLPVHKEIESQVIKSGLETYGDQSLLCIEHLFYGNEKLNNYFELHQTVGGGNVIKFKGSKMAFANGAAALEASDFKNIKPIFEQITSLIS